MNRLTLQEAFNKVWNYYVRDGNRPGLLHTSTDAGLHNFCFYMTPTGDKCSIGCLLSDPTPLSYTRYNIAQLLEGMGVTPEIETVLDEIRFIPTHALMDLQGAHDRATNLYRREGGQLAFLSAMRESLEKFREEYHLEYPT